MEDLIYGKGIFIHSRNLDTSFLIDCLQTLLITYPGIKVTSVFYDEHFNGYRISFKDSEATTMLENKSIIGTYGYTTLYPLTTFLIIHDVKLIGNNDIERNLQDKIQEQLGKVLFLRKFSTIDKNRTASFLVSIDVPESKDISVFTTVGYPDMSIKLPGKFEAFKMEFWCRRCKDYGHIFQECLKKPSNSEEVQERRNSQETNDRNKIEMHSRQKSDARLFPMNLTKDTEVYSGVSKFLESTDSFARKVAREQIMKAGLLGDKDPSKENFKRTETSELASQVADSLLLGRNVRQELYINADVESGRNETLNQDSARVKSSKSTSGAASGNSLVSNNILTDIEIKKEINEDNNHNVPGKTKDAESKENTQAKNFTESAIENSIKKEPDNILRNDENTHSFPPKGMSSSDDDIQVIEHNDNTSSNSTSHLNFREAFSSLKDKAPATESDEIRKESIYPVLVQNVDLPLKSPTQTPTSPLNSNQQQARPSTSSKAFDALSDYFSGVSYNNLSPPSKVNRQQSRPSTSAEVTSCLSDRLQDCITKAYDAHSVLDRKTLDAFLIHVKKKSNPIRVAGNYTPNVQGLKDQLKQILFIYYNTPQTGTKEDIQFIKWLNGLVERFDGTIPRKRKNNKKTSYESPSKK